MDFALLHRQRELPWTRCSLVTLLPKSHPLLGYENH
jgi:hypothetical protein